MTLGCLWLVALAECRLSVEAGASKGSAVVLTRLLPDGGKYVRVDIRLAQATGKKVSITQESTYAADGRPRHKSQTTTLPGGADQVILVAFEPAFARYSVRSGKDATESRVPYPPGSYLATHEFWVLRDKPKPNKQVTYFRFDLAERRWVETKCAYVGKTTLKLGKVSHVAHRIKMGGVTSWLDEQGDPLQIETVGTRMQRL